MDIASCATALCMQVALGFAVPASSATEPPEYFWIPCKSGRMNCHVVYGVPENDEAWRELDQKKLPPVVVVKSQAVHKKRQKPVRQQAAQSGTTVQSRSVFGQVAGQLAEQGARQALVMGAQLKGAAIGAPGGIAGVLVGSWIGCTIAVQGLLIHDFAKAERWDLHPDIAMRNFFHSAIGCSIVGFIQRTMEATNDRDRAFAAVQGLSFVPIPMVSLAGQLAPAGNALLPKEHK